MEIACLHWRGLAPHRPQRPQRHPQVLLAHPQCQHGDSCATSGLAIRKGNASWTRPLHLTSKDARNSATKLTTVIWSSLSTSQHPEDASCTKVSTHPTQSNVWAENQLLSRTSSASMVEVPMEIACLTLRGLAHWRPRAVSVTSQSNLPPDFFWSQASFSRFIFTSLDAAIRAAWDLYLTYTAQVCIQLKSRNSVALSFRNDWKVLRLSWCKLQWHWVSRVANFMISSSQLLIRSEIWLPLGVHFSSITLSLINLHGPVSQDHVILIMEVSRTVRISQSGSVRTCQTGLCHNGRYFFTVRVS